MNPKIIPINIEPKRTLIDAIYISLDLTKTTV